MAALEFAYKPVEIFGHSGSSLNIAGGTIQVNTELAFLGGTLDVRALNTSTVQIGGTVDVRTLANSTVQAITKFDGVNYTPVHKNTIQFGSTAQAHLWVPATGLQINLTDLAVSASTAAQVDIIVGTSTIGPFFFGDNGGLISNFNTPILSAANGTMFIASTGGTVTFTAEGFET